MPDKAVSAGLCAWRTTRSLEVTDVAMTDIKVPDGSYEKCLDPKATGCVSQVGKGPGSTPGKGNQLNKLGALAVYDTLRETRRGNSVWKLRAST
jgi:hypothetical protein